MSKKYKSAIKVSSQETLLANLTRNSEWGVSSGGTNQWVGKEPHWMEKIEILLHVLHSNRMKVIDNNHFFLIKPKTFSIDECIVDGI